MKNKLVFSVVILYGFMITSCVKTPEQQYRDKVEKASDDELLKDVFKKLIIYKVAYREIVSDDLKGYQWNSGLINDLNDGATVQVQFSDNSLYIGSQMFMGSFNSKYYSAEGGRYQVRIMSRHEFNDNPYTVTRLFWKGGIRYNTHGKSYLHEKGIYLTSLREHPAMKANVIVVKDTQGFIAEHDENTYKPATIVFQSLEPLGYYNGPLDKQ
ncbi:MAG: hypothetical protein EOO92_20740 [Pedobacter sp.]|nr:MAG: hypothetical protein EOO92_20740 [Pedobacter sp.]